jgi:hypothetical protein
MEPESTQRTALDDVREFLAGTVPLDVREVAGDELPEPYRSLLVHERDMTGELQAFAGGALHIRPLEVRRSGMLLQRRVLLVCERDGRAVEFGAIRIHLGGFAPAARAEVLACRNPLGAILRGHAMEHACRPRLFFELRGAASLPAGFHAPNRATLFGRVNRIVDGRGALLADVVEVLPRLDDVAG